MKDLITDISTFSLYIFGIGMTIFKVIYLGSIRQANNLNSLIEASKELLDYTNIKIFI